MLGFFMTKSGTGRLAPADKDFGLTGAIGGRGEWQYREGWLDWLQGGAKFEGGGQI